MEVSKELKYFDDLNIDLNLLVNSTLDVYEGCVLIINMEDKKKLNQLVSESLDKNVEVIITSNNCDIDSDKIVKFENYELVFAHVLKKMLPNFTSKNFFGITGTNGKTTTGYYLSQILGNNALFIGTTENDLFKNITNEVHLTTPKLFNIFKLLRRKEYNHIENIILEVSSHALDQERLQGINFKISGFTNLSQDHFDYHENIDKYFGAKQKLFHKNSSQQFVYMDDEWGSKLNKVVNNVSNSIGFNKENDLFITSIEKKKNNTLIKFKVENYDHTIELPFIGPNSEINYLLAVGMAYFSKTLKISEILQNSIDISNPPGRFEKITFNSNDIFIDYAHTPEAISSAIDVVRDIYTKVIVILGAGGNRDIKKRQLMGKASNTADKVIITNDNPRKEDPMDIAKEILSGVDLNSDVEIILDRKLAIKKGLELLQGDYVLLVLGKGHERTQELDVGLVDFDDSKVVKELISKEK